MPGQDDFRPASTSTPSRTPVKVGRPVKNLRPPSTVRLPALVTEASAPGKPKQRDASDQHIPVSERAYNNFGALPVLTPKLAPLANVPPL